MNELFEIVESEDKGKIMIAKVDLLPGRELMTEEPLLIFDSEGTSTVVDLNSSQEMALK